MLNNVSNNVIIIFMCFIGIIILVSIFLLILVIKEDGEKEIVDDSPIKEPDIKISLASNDIPNLKPKKQIPIFKGKENARIESIQDKKNETSIEEVLKAINGDLERQREEKTIEAYEEDQEENAIISYSELVSKTNSIQISDENKIGSYTSRTTSEVISPIYGRQNDSIVKNSVIIEESTDINIIFEETEEFLNSLKEFRKNL